MTADRATIVPFAARVGVGVVDDATDPTLITHNLRTALLGPDLRIIEVYSGNGWTPGEVLADLRESIGGS
jgi:cytochrome oxidase Cu insertion factor (SCO1/SenC/PrrC family)